MMTPRDFCYWLQGFFELSNTNILSTAQIDEIRRHLKMVFDTSKPAIDLGITPDTEKIMETLKKKYNEINKEQQEKAIWKNNNNDFIEDKLYCSNGYSFFPNVVNDPPASC